VLSEEEIIMTTIRIILILIKAIKIIRNNKKETCMLIDVVILGDRNVIKKEAQKILKYEDHNNRNSEHVECEIISIQIKRGTIGTISKSLRQYLSNITGKHNDRKPPYWALRTYCRKCRCKSTEHISRAK